MASSRAGDRDAFRNLFGHFGAMVHSVALGYVDPHGADDVTQEVFLGAWRNLEDLREPEKFGAWLCARARNQAKYAARKLRLERSRLQTHQEESDYDQGQGDCEADSSQPTMEQILDHLRRLPAALREPLTLRLVQRLKGDEIAARLGRPPGSVRVSLHRGMEQLRQSLAKTMEQA